LTTQESQTPLRILYRQCPIVPALRKPEHLDAALAAHGKVVYLLTGNPENCEPMMRGVRAAGKLPIVNLDLMNGLARDKYAVNYLKRCGAAGIISTHGDTLRHVRSIGLYAIQRTFLVDSGAMEAIAAQLKNAPVDALEVLPAQVAYKLLDRARSVAPETLVTGGGLIDNLKEAEELLLQGLSAVSIGNPEMWIA
jgi:glycerol uptake operon antiterminator